MATKYCKLCCTIKPLSEFHKKLNGANTYCKPCAIAKTVKWRSENPEKVASYIRDWRKYGYPRTYGITEQEYEARRAAQNGACAICGHVPERRKGLHLDHCHKTGTLGKFLCVKCNTGIGFFKESPEIMMSAISYLRTYRQHTV